MPSPLLRTVRRVLEARELRYEVEEVDGGAHVLAEPADGPGPWPLILVVDDEDRRVVVYSIAPVNVPPPTRDAVVDLVARINWGLLDSCFEVDHDDGEVRCRSSLLVGEHEAPDDVLDLLVTGNVAAMDTYLDAVLDVAAGDATPAEAISAVEG